ncbi:hypothetical protein [Embleya sp. NPDC059237]|uniref:hypothetical protein n=1 Tax=Embleya sp. NPDC059237 TaxID=3346784 RepID=UPI00367ECDC4
MLGVPAGTLVGGLTDWRIVLVALGGPGPVVVVAPVLLLLPMPASQPVRLRTLGEQFRNPIVCAGVPATLLLVSGHFAAFTFVSPILQDRSGIDET